MKTAFVFPGQGSQCVGMGKAFAEAFAPAKHLFQEVDDALNQKLSTLMFEGPEDQLTLTENAQPAIMAASLAVVRIIEQEAKISLASKGAFIAGHSLGEYSALTAGETFTLADTARLLKLRGIAMQSAVPAGQGAMAALLGLDLDAASAVAKEAAEGDVCAVANDNAPGQIVVSGHTKAIDRAIDIAKAKGAKRAIKLAVSAPFHCPLMEPAARAMDEALSRTTMHSPALPLIANVTADVVRDADTIRSLLVEQVTARVRWRESVETMKAQGVECIVEIGAGKVLTGLIKRIAPDIQAVNLSSPEELEAWLKTA